MNRQIGDRALVRRGSIAGLLAARVLADSYSEVTVIDRDDLPGDRYTSAASPTAATSTHWQRAGSKAWRSCSQDSPRNWSPTGLRPGTS